MDGGGGEGGGAVDGGGDGRGQNLGLQIPQR